MTEGFERGWAAARKELAKCIIAAAESLNRQLPHLPSTVWDVFQEIWEGMSPPPSMPSPPVPLRSGDGGYHGFRSTDPATSREAVRNRPLNWDTQRGIALRIHYENPGGLNDWEVSVLAAESDERLPRDSNWKRVGELRTEYDPPLIAPLLDTEGKVVTRRGQSATRRTVYAITKEGKDAYCDMASRRG